MPATKDMLHENENMLSAYISVPQGWNFFTPVSSLFTFTQNSIAKYTLFTHSTYTSTRPFFHLLHHNAYLFNETEELTRWTKQKHTYFCS